MSIEYTNDSCPTVFNDMTTSSNNRYFLNTETNLNPLYKSLKEGKPIHDILNAFPDETDLNTITAEQKQIMKPIIDLNCGFTYINRHANLSTSEAGDMKTIMHLARESESSLLLSSLLTDKFTQTKHRYSYGFDINKNKFTYKPQDKEPNSQELPKYEGVFQSFHIESKGIIEWFQKKAELEVASLQSNKISVDNMKVSDDAEYDIRYFSIIYKDGSEYPSNKNIYFIKSKLVKKIKLKHDSTHLFGSVYLCEFEAKEIKQTYSDPKNDKHPHCKTPTDLSKHSNENCEPPTKFILQLRGKEHLFLKNPLNHSENTPNNIVNETNPPIINQTNPPIVNETNPPTATGGKRTIKRKKIYREKNNKKTNNKKTNNKKTKKYRKITKRTRKRL